MTVLVFFATLAVSLAVIGGVGVLWQKMAATPSGSGEKEGER